jgi:hypothetical protein
MRSPLDVANARQFTIIVRAVAVERQSSLLPLPDHLVGATIAATTGAELSRGLPLWPVADPEQKCREIRTGPVRWLVLRESGCLGDAFEVAGCSRYCRRASSGSMPVGACSPVAQALSLRRTRLLPSDTSSLRAGRCNGCRSGEAGTVTSQAGAVHSGPHKPRRPAAGPPRRCWPRHRVGSTARR